MLLTKCISLYFIYRNRILSDSYHTFLQFENLKNLKSGDNIIRLNGSHRHFAFVLDCNSVESTIFILSNSLWTLSNIVTYFHTCYICIHLIRLYLILPSFNKQLLVVCGVVHHKSPSLASHLNLPYIIFFLILKTKTTQTLMPKCYIWHFNRRQDASFLIHATATCFLLFLHRKFSRYITGSHDLNAVYYQDILRLPTRGCIPSINSLRTRISICWKILLCY